MRERPRRGPPPPRERNSPEVSAVFAPTLLPNHGEMESDQLGSTGFKGVVQGCGMATAAVSVSKIADKRKSGATVSWGTLRKFVVHSIHTALLPVAPKPAYAAHCRQLRSLSFQKISEKSLTSSWDSCPSGSASKPQRVLSVSKYFRSTR